MQRPEIHADVSGLAERGLGLRRGQQQRRSFNRGRAWKGAISHATARRNRSCSANNIGAIVMSKSTFAVTRRQVLGAGTIVAAAYVAPAIAQSDTGQGSGQNGTLVPPSYPKPPFEIQHQEWPGLAKDMKPIPDHGEKTYKGSGRLKGRKALLTGGDSGIGRAAAIAYAREGADVAINYLADEQPDADEVLQLIEAAGRKAIGLPGDIRDEGFCKELVSKANDGLGGLDILVNDAGRQH